MCHYFQVYISYLFDEHISLFQLSNITFLCPGRISIAQIKQDFHGVQKYLKNTFMIEMKKTEKYCNFILALYLEGNHWVLYAIYLRMSLVYKFDSAIRPESKPRNSELSKILSLLYNIYMSHLKGIAFEKSKAELLHLRMECAQQPGDIDSGYYVMRYMYEIVSTYSECKGNLQEMEY